MYQSKKGCDLTDPHSSEALKKTLTLTMNKGHRRQRVDRENQEMKIETGTGRIETSNK